MEPLDPAVPWVQVEDRGAYIRCHCNVCQADVAVRTEAEIDAFMRGHQAHRSASPTHLGAGDLVAAATKRLGIQPCSPCEARRRALNQAMPRVPFFRRR